MKSAAIFAVVLLVCSSCSTVPETHALSSPETGRTLPDDRQAPESPDGAGVAQAGPTEAAAASPAVVADTAAADVHPAAVQPADLPPADSGAATADKAPLPEQPEIQPLSDAELTAAALRLVPSPHRPIYRSGAPLRAILDVDLDGIADICLLTIDTRQPEETNFTVLSQFNRLYTRKPPFPRFYLDVFVEKQRAVSFAGTVDLGAYPVLEGIYILPLRTEKLSPAAVVVHFQNHDGAEQEWSVFSGKPVPGRLSLFDTPTTHPVVRDIDDDGTTEILVYRTAFEEGVGYETFISRYEYNGTTFEETESINIVRNLRAFLSTARRLLLDENWSGFLKACVDPESVARLRARAFTDRKIVAEIFRAIAGDSGDGSAQPFDFANPGDKLQNIIFPDVLESPFSDPDRFSSFGITVRVVCCDGENSYYDASISMAKNPFGDRQFSFDTESPSTH